MANKGDDDAKATLPLHFWGSFQHHLLVKWCPVTDCDILAAAPIDSHRRISGISLDQIDVNRAVPACEAAVRRYPNDAHFRFQLSRAYYEAQNFQAAVAQLRKAAEQGHALAQYNLGVMYEYGKGVSEDYGEALIWYRKAADQGDEMAKNKLDRLTSIDLDTTTKSFGRAPKQYFQS